MTRHKTLFFMLSILVVLCLSSCGDSSASVESASDSTESTISQKPVNTTPIVSKSDLTGIWTGGQSTDVGHIKYLYFSSNGVYWMANKDGKPSSGEFTSEYLIASSYSISVNDGGDTICHFGNWTATFSSRSNMYVSGRTISGTYRK